MLAPIILDLDGNGVRTVAADESNALYDLDGDGLADDTSWIGSTEGFLFLDRDDNGTVTNAGEFSFIDDLPDATSDLVGLRAFDSNNDGKLSSADARWASFKVWRDSDGDGAVDTGEVLSMASAGVASLNLTGTAFNGNSAFGEVAVLNTGSYTRTNGATMQFLDAALTYFSAASNLPELDEQSYGLELKAGKYAISISGGAMVIAPKRSKGTLDAAAGRIGANATLTFKDKSVGMLGAIALDLDGNGVELKRFNKNNAGFDMNGDGGTDDTGWLSKRDAFLVIDRDGDGKITDAAELNFAAEDGDAMSALEGLATLDSNGDGKLDVRDARFSELRVWIDRNQNGVTDAGELQTLSEAGIASFSLRATAARDYAIKVGENAVLSTSTFTRTNGSIGTLGNVALAYLPGAANPAALDVAAGGGSTSDEPWLAEPSLTSGQSDSGIAPAIEAAIATLRQTSTSDPLAMFNLSGDSAAFDALAQQTPATLTVQRTLVQAAAERPGQSPAPVAELVSSEELSGYAPDADSMDAARRLALLRQDIAGFGGHLSLDRLDWSRGGDPFVMNNW